MDFEMNARVRMSREFDFYKDNISVGGYVIEVDGEQYSFDFNGYRYAKDGKNLEITGTALFEEYYPDVENITAETIKKMSRFTDFFIFTGEKGETDLKPVKLLSCSFTFLDTAEVVILPPEVIKKSVVASNIE